MNWKLLNNRHEPPKGGSELRPEAHYRIELQLLDGSTLQLHLDGRVFAQNLTDDLKRHVRMVHVQRPPNRR